MTERIPYSCQNIDDTDIAAVVEAMRSPFLTQGPRVSDFEAAAAKKVGAAHGVAVSNGTAALHILYAALGIAPGKLVWTSPNSFVASSNAALYLGADVDFVDIDPATGAIDPAALERKLDECAAPDLLSAVHFAGHTAGFERIAQICEAHGIVLVEDAAHAFGATYEDRPDTMVGAHPQSAAATFSFHPLKSITTGEGGLITTDIDSLAADLAMLRSHGTTKHEGCYTAAREDDGGWYYEQHMLGFNYRLCDLQAALGLSQIKRLDAFMEGRRSVARRYHKKLADAPLLLPSESDASAWHLFVVRLDRTKTNVTRRRMFDALRAESVEAHVHYIPIHTQPYYRKLGFTDGDFPMAEEYYDTCLSLPIFPDMSDAQQERVVDLVRREVG